MQKMSEINGLKGAALLIYIFISEGSRVIPPRNLIPIPQGVMRKMSAEEKIKRYLFDKGDLHDCVVENFSWHPKARRFEVSILDVNAGFLGLPEHPGRQPATFVLAGVSALGIELEVLSERLVIFEMLLSGTGKELSLDMGISPSGKISVAFSELSVVE